jgi:hypothetical protein
MPVADELSVFLGQQDGRHGPIGFGDDPDASAVPQFVGREHSSAFAHGAQVLELILGAEIAGVEVDVPGDEVDGVLTSRLESTQSPWCRDETAEQEV